MPDPERILIIRPSALGDVCRTVPALASLRRAYPSARIDWVVRDSFSEAVSAHPALSHVVPFHRAELGRSMARANPLPTMHWLRELRRTRYDLVFDLQGLFRSGVFTWATRARRRVGFQNARECAWLAYNERRTVDRSMHTVDRMLALIDHAGVEVVHDMRLYAPGDARTSIDADRRFESPFVVLAPSSIWPAKRWPADRFASLAERLLATGVENVVVVGAPNERDQCAPLLDMARRDDRVVDCVGTTSIGMLMAIIERARLVVANDSAPLHMAVGFDRPIVALFGPTRTDLVGPYRRDDDVIQHLEPGDRIDHKHDDGAELMRRISVDEAFAAAMARLHRPDAPGD